MKISNKHITAHFTSKGAEMTSLKLGDREYLWQADPAHWKRHAPVLFPIVGRLKEDTFFRDDKAYHMTQHGFARDMEFELQNHNSDSITFLLRHNEQSLAKYPFKFELSISYELIGHSVRVSYQVENKGNQELPFSIGGHPAFNCPLTEEESRSDYWLEFDQQEILNAQRIESGIRNGQAELISEDGKIRIANSLFDEDALIFSQLKSNSVDLKSNHGTWLTMKFDGFPYFGVWSSDREANFVCLEPWIGVTDHSDHNQQLTEKEGIVQLFEDDAFECSYTIEIKDPTAEL